jgi:superfamily II DNA or RNA helicase
MTGLRDYQGAAINAAREALTACDRVCVQGPTGSGKSVVISAILKSAMDKGNTCWVVIPRKELIRQQSAHLSKWGVKHGFIDASHKESRAYKCFIVSRETVMRRLGKIKQPPALILFDEAHIALEAQKKIIRAMTETAGKVKVLGFTATPETLVHPMTLVYQTCVYGPPITYLTQAGYLSPVRYFAPPVEGLENLHWRMGEVKEDELEAIMKKHAVYGKAAEYYKRYGQGRRALVFCRDIRASAEIAAEFRAAGVRAESIDGGMGMGKRKFLVDGLVSGRLDVITSAELFCYGIDIPAVEYIALMRPTQSKAIYFQQVGRGMRVSEGKKDCLVFDHVDNISRFQDSRYPGVPLFSVPDLTWNFGGEKKKAKKEALPPPEVRRCPFNAFEICLLSIRCPQCEKYAPAGDEGVPVIESIPLRERRTLAEAHIITEAEKREAQDEVIRYTDIALTAADNDSYERAVAELVKIADRLGHSPLWVYHLVNKNEFVVNVRLINAIGKAKGYKPGWAYHVRDELKAILNTEGKRNGKKQFE